MVDNQTNTLFAGGTIMLKLFLWALFLETASRMSRTRPSLSSKFYRNRIQETIASENESTDNFFKKMRLNMSSAVGAILVQVSLG